MIREKLLSRRKSTFGDSGISTPSWESRPQEQSVKPAWLTTAQFPAARLAHSGTNNHPYLLSSSVRGFRTNGKRNRANDGGQPLLRDQAPSVLMPSGVWILHISTWNVTHELAWPVGLLSGKAGRMGCPSRETNPQRREKRALLEVF